MMAVDLAVLPPAKLVPILIRLGEPGHVDIKENAGYKAAPAWTQTYDQ